MRSYPVKENHPIGSAVSEILLYKQTDRLRSTLYYRLTFFKILALRIWLAIVFSCSVEFTQSKWNSRPKIFQRIINHCYIILFPLLNFIPVVKNIGANFRIKLCVEKNSPKLAKRQSGCLIVNNNGNVDNKFQPSILNSSRENHIFPIFLQTHWQTDRHTAFQISFAILIKAWDSCACLLSEKNGWKCWLDVKSKIKIIMKNAYINKSVMFSISFLFYSENVKSNHFYYLNFTSQKLTNYV